MPNDFVEVGPLAGVEFGMEQFAIGADFGGAAAGWDQGERRDPIAELEDLSRQTDGFRGVVSNRAVFDPDLEFHRVLLSKARVATTDAGSRCSGSRLPVSGRHARRYDAIVRLFWPYSWTL